jgi:hypothetical protein
MLPSILLAGALLASYFFSLQVLPRELRVCGVSCTMHLAKVKNTLSRNVTHRLAGLFHADRFPIITARIIRFTAASKSAHLLLAVHLFRII